MGKPITRQLLDKIASDWDARARENARHYVNTASECWSDDEFFRSGEETVANEILTDMQNICQGRDPKEMTVLEIGCGAGRVTKALARVFGRVHAVDVSCVRGLFKFQVQGCQGFETSRTTPGSGRRFLTPRP